VRLLWAADSLDFDGFGVGRPLWVDRFAWGYPPRVGRLILFVFNGLDGLAFAKFVIPEGLRVNSSF
jgi:hypothetical protein